MAGVSIRFKKAYGSVAPPITGTTPQAPRGGARQATGSPSTGTSYQKAQDEYSGHQKTCKACKAHTACKQGMMLKQALGEYSLGGTFAKVSTVEYAAKSVQIRFSQEMMLKARRKPDPRQGGLFEATTERKAHTRKVGGKPVQVKQAKIRIKKRAKPAKRTPSIETKQRARTTRTNKHGQVDVIKEDEAHLPHIRVRYRDAGGGGMAGVTAVRPGETQEQAATRAFPGSQHSKPPRTLHDPEWEQQAEGEKLTASVGPKWTELQRFVPNLEESELKEMVRVMMEGKGEKASFAKIHGAVKKLGTHSTKRSRLKEPARLEKYHPSTSPTDDALHQMEEIGIVDNISRKGGVGKPLQWSAKLTPLGRRVGERFGYKVHDYES